MDEQQFVVKCIDQFYLNLEDINKISKKIKGTSLRNIFIKYMSLKANTYNICKNYSYTLLSVGQNCFPHTMSIRTGIKFPFWIRREHRLFFDLAVTNLHNSLSILSSNLSDLELCDSYENNYFISVKYNFKYNHDTKLFSHNTVIILLKICCQ